jgi:hypothetical protein
VPQMSARQKPIRPVVAAGKSLAVPRYVRHA